MNDNSPKVTVIIPCYNASRYLQQTIDSVLAQTYPNVHIIAVNDGSTDDTAVILNSYADRITVLNHDDYGNHGQAASLNLGFAHNDSEYVAFLDSDDVWHQDKLRKQVHILDEFQNIGLVYTNGYVIDGNGKELYTLFDKNHVENNMTGSILLNCYIRTPSLVMIRSSILKAAGLFTVGIIPDQDMWIRTKELTSFIF